MDEKKKKIQLNFSDSSFEDLVDLQEKTEVTQQEVFISALAWLKWTVEEIREGGKFLVEEPNGKVKEVVAPFLVPTKSSTKE